MRSRVISFVLSALVLAGALMLAPVSGRLPARADANVWQKVSAFATTRDQQVNAMAVYNSKVYAATAGIFASSSYCQVKVYLGGTT